MATHDEKIRVFVESFDVETCYWIAFDRFVNQSLYFLLTLIEETDWTITAAYCYKIFDCCDAVNYTLWNIYVSMESISNFVE